MKVDSGVYKLMASGKDTKRYNLSHVLSLNNYLSSVKPSERSIRDK